MVEKTYCHVRIHARETEWVRIENIYGIGLMMTRIPALSPYLEALCQHGENCDPD